MSPAAQPPPFGEDAPGAPVLGVVIPALDEAALLRLLLEDLGALAVPHTVVVADGGSTDGTREIARKAGARVVRSEPGRARQMNEGARVAGTPWLLFLHADSRVPAETLAALAAWLRDPPPEEAAHFRFRLDQRGWFFRAIEGGQRVRERLSGLAYGDQGLLLSNRRFEALGGIPDLPIMEDVEAVRRLRRSGGLQRIEAPVVTSARRYVEEGPLRAWLRNASLLARHLAGAPTHRLAARYPIRRAEAPDRDVVLIFARAPVPGRVKTRLAREVGDERAAAIYLGLGRRVVDQLREGPWRTQVCFDPPEEETRVRRWLGEAGLRFRAQGEGGLGERMNEAFGAAFEEGAARVCIVGTDAPGVDEARVAEAFHALDAADAVFGPALDGGYYLLALREPAPELFRDVPWSTGAVLRTSLRRAREAGLRVRTLEPLGDVDRAADLPLVGG